MTKAGTRWFRRRLPTSSAGAVSSGIRNTKLPVVAAAVSAAIRIRGESGEHTRLVSCDCAIDRQRFLVLLATSCSGCGYTLRHEHDEIAFHDFGWISRTAFGDLVRTS